MTCKALLDRKKHTYRVIDNKLYSVIVAFITCMFSTCCLEIHDSGGES